MSDSFAELAPYYDRIMEQVDYDRWFTVTTELGRLLPRPFRHLDAACGTGVLLKRLRRFGWNSVGIDLSFAMLRAGRKASARPPAVNADLRALPMNGTFDFVTCLFDSLNFLLELRDLRMAFRELATVLTDRGLLYFDVVTERMVLDHFAGQRWIEKNGKLSTAWESQYCRNTAIAETYVAIQNGPIGTLRERIYDRGEIEKALGAEGFHILGVFDAETWKSVRRKTVRVDFVATRADPRPLRKPFKTLSASIRKLIA